MADLVPMVERTLANDPNGETIRRLLPGAAFELARNVPHAKRYGAEGATYWVARRR